MWYQVSQRVATDPIVSFVIAEGVAHSPQMSVGFWRDCSVLLFSCVFLWLRSTDTRRMLFLTDLLVVVEGQCSLCDAECRRGCNQSNCLFLRRGRSLHTRHKCQLVSDKTEYFSLLVSSLGLISVPSLLVSFDVLHLILDECGAANGLWQLHFPLLEW